MSQKKPLELTLHSLQLRDVFLDDAKLESSKLNIDKSDEKVNQPFIIKTSTGVDITSKNDFAIYLDIEIESKIASMFDLSIRIIGLGHYLDEGATKKQLQMFAESSGVYLLMPYARMYIANLSQLMGYPPLLLPLTKVPSKLLKEKKRPTKTTSKKRPTKTTSKKRPTKTTSKKRPTKRK